MKKKLLFFALLVGSLGASATDIYVEENGLGGAFTSITDAVNASVSGDRIIIFPKAGGAYYIENLNIVNKNLELNSYTAGELWRLQGLIQVQGSSQVQINHAEIKNTNNYCVYNYSGTRVVLAGSKLDGFFVNYPNSTCVLANDSLFNSYVNIQGSARVSGCYIQQRTGSLYGLQAYTTGTVTNDSLVIVGNVFDGVATNNLEMLYDSCYDRYSYIANNLFYMRSTSVINPGAVRLVGGRGNATYINTFMNNTIINLSPMAANYGVFYNQGPTSWRMMNNVVHSTLSNMTMAFQRSGNYPNLMRYNYVKIPGGTAFNGAVSSSNVATSNMVLNADGSPQAGSDIIDGGSPDGGMMDVDLSRNDAGCYGGSYTMSNFTSAETGARVLFMEAPRSIFLNQSIDVKGEGLDK